MHNLWLFLSLYWEAKKTRTSVPNVCNYWHIHCNHDNDRNTWFIYQNEINSRICHIKNDKDLRRKLLNRWRCEFFLSFVFFSYLSWKRGQPCMHSWLQTLRVIFKKIQIFIKLSFIFLKLFIFIIIDVSNSMLGSFY